MKFERRRFPMKHYGKSTTNKDTFDFFKETMSPNLLEIKTYYKMMILLNKVSCAIKIRINRYCVIK